MTFTPREVYEWSSAVLAALRWSLDAHKFSEILPAILSERYEPGARHSIAVLGDRALPQVMTETAPDGASRVSITGTEYYYLPVSHCVEKQLALEHAERVYCMAPCLRLLMEGEDVTGRHLYTFFQAELEWRTESVDEVYVVTEAVLAHFARTLLKRLADGDYLGRAACDRIQAFADTPYRRLTFAEARQRVSGVGGAINPHAVADLTHAQEEALSAAACGPFWLTDYPDGVRDSLYRRRANGTYATYDLILPAGYGELATGGLRPESGDAIRAQAARFSATPHTYYAEWKSRVQVQTGGLGIGVERLIRYCMGASSILDVRFAHDQGPNAHVGELASAWT